MPHQGAPGYYEILGVPKTADASEICRAYKRRAMESHPDKNRGREQEATEEFKLVGEAYACLRDPQKRAAYDHEPFAGPCGRGCEPSSAPSRSREDFTFSMAEDLFSEIFGPQATARLKELAQDLAPHVQTAATATADLARQAAPHVQAAATAAAAVFGGAAKRCSPYVQTAASTTVDLALHAAPHVQAAASVAAMALGGAVEQCSRTKAVRGLVAAGLSSIAAEADQKVTGRELEVGERARQLEAAQEELRSHMAMRRERERKQGWASMLRVLTRLASLLCCSVDAEAERTKQLQTEAVRAEMRLADARGALAHAQAASGDARLQAESVQQEGASLESAALAGLHFAGRLFGGKS
mmetsp:Transcript_24673/g.70989  ORF Transcript_24673/g.70989 Transcript_24673/m.70989 type:complete len:356 (-) Transcript_24673:84-1151(-)